MGTAAWNVLFVMQGKEFTVKDKIDNFVKAEYREGIKEILLPVTASTDEAQKKKNIKHVPIYPGYIFIQMERTEGLISKIMSIDNVIKFLGSSSESPSVLRDSEIKQVKSMMNEGKKSNIHRYKLNEMVEITGGHCKKLSGKIVKINEASESFDVEIQLFNRSITTLVKVEDVKDA